MASYLFLQRSQQLDARRHHYLISTAVRPGIYASPLKRPQVSQRELELRNAKPLSTLERNFLERQRLTRSFQSGVVDAPLEISRPGGGEFVTLPPIHTEKPQVRS